MFRLQESKQPTQTEEILASLSSVEQKLGQLEAENANLKAQNAELTFTIRNSEKMRVNQLIFFVFT